MKKEIAQLLADQNDDLMISNHYIGRGMHNPTSAISGTFRDFMLAFSSVLDKKVQEAMECFDDDDKEALHNDVFELTEAIGKIRYDSIGMDLIFY